MDRISNLPDGIIVHILSFLTTEEAASTSLLSKRWRNMFVFSPVLDLSRIKRSTCLYALKVQKFKEFVNRLLAVSGNSAIRRFALTCYVESAHTHNWIRNVVKRGVLDLRILAEYSVPVEVFACKTLVKLRLSRLVFAEDANLHLPGLVIPMLEDASLPALKSLFLSFVGFDDVGAFEKLISACPSLEELIIYKVFCESWEFSRILSSLTLKRLTVVCYNNRNLGSMNFDLPNLVYLEYTGPVQRQYPVVNLDFLVEAKLDLVMTEPGNCDLSNLIGGLGNVKILHLLSAETVEIFGTFLEEMHVFKNLIHLSVRFPRHVCLPGSYVPSLLEKSPKLQTLLIEGFLVHNNTEIDCKCFLDCSRLSSCPLKVLKLVLYDGDIKELEQMKHFLEKLPCLELLKIRTYARDDKEKLRLTTDLLMLPRASSKCKIQFDFS